jgi:hypothetical protein
MARAAPLGAFALARLSRRLYAPIIGGHKGQETLEFHHGLQG